MLGSFFFVGIFLLRACGRLGPPPPAEKSFFSIREKELPITQLIFLAQQILHWTLPLYHFFATTTVRTANMKLTITAVASMAAAASAFVPCSFVRTAPVAHRAAESSSTSLDMKYKVAVVGGGPSGACAAEIFAQEKGIDTVLFERKLDNAKPCGGAIPLCMVGEFDLPESVVDRKVG